MNGAFSVKYRTKTIQVAKPLRALDECQDINYLSHVIDYSVIIYIFVIRMLDSWQEIEKTLGKRLKNSWQEILSTKY